MNILKRYLLEIIVFLTGGVVMVLELCGSRLLAPFVGVSIIVWTSLIGIILGSLSLGYFWGGKIADKGGTRRTLSLILFAAAISVLGILMIKSFVFSLAEAYLQSLSIKAVFSTFTLFFLPNIFLGMVTPLATKLKLQSIKTAGGVIGNLYAFSTLGSIAGTFLTGFVLLAHFSTTNIILGLGFVLLILSLLLSVSFFFSKTITILLFSGLGIFFVDERGVVVFESQYNHVALHTTVDYATGKRIKVLRLDNKWDSAMFLDSNDLVFAYTKYYRMAKHIIPEANRVLMIGGGGYSVPKDFLSLYDDVFIDVVELDPFLTKLAHAEFRLRDDPRLSIYHEDGRTFLNREAAKKRLQYDAIFVDAFNSYSIPFHLTTVEAVQNMRTLLSEHGVIIVNLISAIDGEKGQFLQAEYATYKAVFPQVYLFPVDHISDGSLTQNIMLVAARNSGQIQSIEDGYAQHMWHTEVTKKHILTDEFAPVDQYVIKNDI